MKNNRNPIQPANPLFIRDQIPHFQLSSLYKDFEQDDLALKEFVEVVIMNLAKLKVEILDALDQNNFSLYEQVHYKTLTTLSMIQAEYLQDLLVQGKNIFKKTGNSAKTVVFNDLEQEFSTILSFLKVL